MNPEITNPRSSYSLDRTGPREKQRLEAQAPFLDPGTIRHVKALGLLSGWHCAEVGAGAGSIAIWLAERVGRSGRVVATDVDTRFIAHLRRDGLEIRRHDILAGPVEANAFDLVHTRLLLSPLADRAKAMNNLVASLRPGGWLLAEEYDLSTAGSFHPPSALQSRLNDAVQSLLRQSGGDPRSGIRLVQDMTAAGLAGVVAEGRLEVVRLGTPAAESLALRLEPFRDQLLEQGLVTEDEFNRAIEEVQTAGEGAVHYPPLMVAAWGRRPVRGV